LVAMVLPCIQESCPWLGRTHSHLLYIVNTFLQATEWRVTASSLHNRATVSKVASLRGSRIEVREAFNRANRRF